MLRFRGHKFWIIFWPRKRNVTYRWEETERTMEKRLRTEERYNFYTYTANRRSLKNQNTSGALRKNRKPLIKKYKNRKTDNKWPPYPFSVWNCPGWGGTPYICRTGMCGLYGWVFYCLKICMKQTAKPPLKKLKTKKHTSLCLENANHNRPAKPQERTKPHGKSRNHSEKYENR